MTWRARAASAALVLSCACARLPEIPGGECGNGVIEPPEDCDTFADGGALCRPKGSVGECHLDCARQDDNSTACPVGWGCDSSGLCRRPTGELEPAREFEVGSATVLASGDFDGDGSGDVASFEEPDAIGYTHIKFHYFDERAALADTRVFPPAVIAPSIGELSGDRRNDLAFSDLSVGVLLGRADQTWVPETFSSYRIPDTSIRTLSVFNGIIQQQTSGFIVFAKYEGVTGLYVPDGRDVGFPRLLGTLDGPVEMLAGDPVSGRVIRDELASPCQQAALAFRGATSFSVFDTCGRDLGTGLPYWLLDARTWRIPLEPAAPIDGAPQLVDVNADGNLDALVGAAGGVYVAYGDGVSLATATPYALPLASSTPAAPNLPMPLAAADVTGDGALDLVFSTGLFLSVPSADPALFDYLPVTAPAPGYYSAAIIADLNRDGDLDVAMASATRPGITFFNGTGTRDLIAFSVPTNRPVQHLAVGDFDGDRINDLAFTQNDAEQDAASSVMIAFGTPAGPPLSPAPVARVDNIEQLQPFREGAIDHLLLTSAELGAEQRLGVLTVLVGATTRIPMALYDLTNFATDSSTLGSAAYRTLAGHFTQRGQGDVLALATPAGIDAAPEVWLLPALTTSAGTPVRLAGGLNPALHPVTSTDTGNVLTIATATADVDGDGRDEALLAMPAEDADHCGVVILTVEPTEVVERALLGVDEPCSRVELLPVDVDGDGFVELALLTGRLDRTERRLSIFWNDGRGAFDRERQTLVADAAANAQAFTVLPATPAAGVSLVYATASGVERVHIDAASREPGAPSLLSPMLGVTGMTAADLNGDGAVDVALAARGNLHVLRATLEAL